jgi:hypothetical protein
MSLVEIYYDDTLLDIADNEVVPITKQVNEVGDLNTLKSDFTREFKVKRTRQMELLFENAGLISSTTTVPYTELQVYVYVDGLEVIPKGRLTLNRTDELYYYFNVYSGAKNFFDTIKDKKLGELDISALDHTWNASTAASSIVFDRNYKYLACDHSDDGLMIELDGANFKMNDYTTRPFVKAKYLFDKIMTTEAVVLDSDIESDALFAKMYLNIVTIKANNPNMEAYFSELQFIHYFPLLVGETKQIELNTRVQYIYNPKSIIWLDNNAVLAPFTAKYKMQFDVDYVSENADYDVQVNVNDVLADAEIERTIFSSTRTFITIDINLTIGDVAKFYVKNNISGTWYFQFNRFRILSIEYDKVAIGSTFIMANHLPVMSQADYVKGICKFFGLIPDYDIITNTLRLWNINRVITNKNIAADWSKYLSVSDYELTYSLDYAKVNRLKWKADKDVVEGLGNAAINVNDETLVKEKTILDMPFSFCRTASRTIPASPSFIAALASIGWYQSIPDSTDYKENENVAPRLVTAEAVGTGVGYYDILNTTTYLTTEAQALKASVDLLSLNTAISYNAAITNMLNSTKVLKLKFNLPAKVIAGLDHSIPIYLEQYTEYFFIKKVSNWIAGKLCEVELIKI